MTRWLARATGLIVVLGLAAGCGGGPLHCDVKGTVLFDGKPLPGGTVQLTDEADTQMAFADLTIDGTFVMNQAPAGPVRVVVRTESVKTLLDEKTVKALQRKGIPGVVAVDPKVKGNKYVAIPTKYADRETTDVRLALRPNQVNELTVELKK